RRLNLAVHYEPLPFAPILPREIGVPRRPMRAEKLIARATRQREIADRERMRSAGLGVAAPVAQCVELCHITEREPGLAFPPFAQANLERTVRARGEWTERKRVRGVRPRSARSRNEDIGLPFAHGDDGGIEPKLDLRIVVPRLLRRRRFAPWLSHRGGYAARSAGRADTSASSAILPPPISSTALIMRPSRVRISSASATNSRLG